MWDSPPGGESRSGTFDVVHVYRSGSISARNPHENLTHVTNQDPIHHVLLNRKRVPLARIGARNPHENPTHVDVCENGAAVGVSAFSSPAELARSRCGLEKSRNARAKCLNPILKWPLPSGIRAAVSVSAFFSPSTLARSRCGLARSRCEIRAAVGVSAFFSPAELARLRCGLARSHCGIRAAVGVSAFFSPSTLARLRCGLARCHCGFRSESPPVTSSENLWLGVRFGLARSHCGIRAAVGVSAFFSAAEPVAGWLSSGSCSQATRR